MPPRQKLGVVEFAQSGNLTAPLRTRKQGVEQPDHESAEFVTSEQRMDVVCTAIAM